MRLSILFVVLATGLLSAFAQTEKEWTVLVFLNGKNSLDDFGFTNINQMETVGSTDAINILVEWGSTKNGNHTKRLLVKKDTDLKDVTSPVIQDMGSVDMGDWNSVVDFVTWGVKNYPAKKYFLDIWDHGSGWHNDLRSRCSKGALNDISWDEQTGSSITTKQLAQALAGAAKAIGHKIDLYASDACLMAMAEIADEVADSVDIFAGSEETEPGLGWPYDKLLSRWTQNPSISAAEVSKILSEEYVKSFQKGDQATFSSFDVSGYMTKFNAAVKSLSEKIISLDSASKRHVVKLMASTLSFVDDDYRDFFDFVTRLDAAHISGIPKDLLTELRSLESSFVVSSGATDYTNAHGVSMWFPLSRQELGEQLSLYKTLKFHAHTNWGAVFESIISTESDH